MSSPYTLPQQVALAVLPKASGWASGLLSLTIVATVARDPRRRSRTYHRLVGGLSLVDFSSSLWLSLSTWPIPRESGILWASGTDATCRLQGFFTQFGIASILYNSSLSLYFVLVICRGWREHQVRKVEPYMHGIPILWALGTSSAGLGLDAFGSANLWCWVRPASQAFRWAAFYAPLWLMILWITGTCLYIYAHVKKIEAATDRRRVRLLAGYSNQRRRRQDLHDVDQEEGGTADLLESDEVKSSVGRCHHESSGDSSSIASVAPAGSQRPSRPPPLNSEAHATAGEETREYQDDDLDPEAFRRGGDDDDDDDEAAMEGDEDGPEEEDPDDDDGTASGEKCVASSVFEDVVLSRTNQTLETANAAELGNDAKGGSQPGKSSLKDDSDVGDIEAGGGSTQAAVRRSYRDHKKSGNLRRQLGLLLARDELRLRRTRQVARQSFLYAGAFYLNWTALSITRLLQTVQGRTYYPLLVIAALTVPIQGLPNFLVYLAPKPAQGRNPLLLLLQPCRELASRRPLLLLCCP